MAFYQLSPRSVIFHYFSCIVQYLPGMLQSKVSVFFLKFLPLFRYDNKAYFNKATVNVHMLKIHLKNLSGF